MVQQLQGDSLESRVARLHELQKAAPTQLSDEFMQALDMSWIYHDSALEGVAYREDELRAAILEDVPEDASLLPVYDEIRNHKSAIDTIRRLAKKKRLNVSLDVIKDLYAQLAPEELEGRASPTYRRDVPLHKLYFHEIAPPEKISYRMRNLVQWMNAAETKRATHAVRLASKAHYQLLHIYPFPRQSGKVARLVLNLVLLHNGYPPVVIHATERQQYYDALRQSEDAIAQIVTRALEAAVESTIRFFEMQGVR